MRSRLRFVTDWEGRAVAANYKVVALARLSGASVSQLSRFFLCSTGVTPKEWMNRIRQGRALELLANGKSIKEAGYELGYKQSSHFSREFKRFHGVPPSEFDVLCAPGLGPPHLRQGPMGVLTGDAFRQVGWVSL